MVVSRLLRVVLALAFTAGPVAAQTGTLTGKVTDSTSSAAIDQAIVEAVQGSTTVGSALASEDGTYRIAALPPGTYSVNARRVGYRPKRIGNITVAAGQTVTTDIQLVPNAQNLQTVTTVSRREEKIQDAPANISVVETAEIAERPSVTAADHLRGVSGVDATQGGIAQTNVVTRGFNNAFSGAMLMLQDYRFAGVPSLRVNVPLLFTGTNEDIERMEILLGPASALYGPNSATGVLHINTTSPFAAPGTIVTLDAGERSIFRGSARHAGAVNERFGYKLSGEYFTGRDWRYDDPAEPDIFPASAPTGREGQPNVRNFDVERITGEARIDIRPTTNSELVTTYGYTKVGSGLELTGSQGTAQVKNWTYQNIQQRMRFGNLFLQGFVNFSDAGNQDSTDLGGTYLLRGGQPIVDQSRVFAAQIQHSFDIGGSNSIVYGADYIKTNPRTGNTINGRNEDIDDVQEVGGYAQLTSRFSPKFDFIAALRVDNHDYLDETYLSPRVAMVFKPNPGQSLRATYNHAFSTPANFSFFLDLPQGVIPIPGTAGYTIRGMGVPSTGWNYARNCATGAGQLCMRSVFPQVGPTGQPIVAPNTSVDANAALYYRTLVGGNQQAFINALLQAGVTPANAPLVFGALFGTAPNNTQVGTTLRQFVPPRAPTDNPFPLEVNPTDVEDLSKLKATISDVFEVGYKAVVGRGTSLALDGWYEIRKNFTTASTNVTPNAFFNPTQLGAWLGGILTQQAQAGRVPAAAVAPLATAFTNSLARVPIGTVVPDSPLADRPDLFFTYKNISESIDIFGIDFSVDHPLSDMFSVAATYSFMSKSEFEDIIVGPAPLALNAPNHQASLTGRWVDGTRGMRFELRGRYTNAYPVNSGVYVGTVPVGAFMDALFAWRLPFTDNALTWSLTANNLLNNTRPTFVGVPDVTRMVMTRLSYAF